MRMVYRILAASLISACIAAGLSFLLQIGGPLAKTGGDLVVFKPISAKQLTDTNLVDALKELPLNSDIKKVDWSHSMLTIDLKLSKRIMNQEMVYLDLFNIAEMALVNTANVEQVLIRVLDDYASNNTGEGQLLVAMDAKRENLHKTGKKRLKADLIDLEQHLRTHFHLIYTPKWKEQFSS